MPGFLDTINNLSPEQSEGLLAAAAQMLQASGPSRTPVSFGQVFGSGLQAFQQGKKGAEDRAFEGKLRNFKLKDIESDYANQEAARAQAQRLASFRQSLGGGMPQENGQQPPISRQPLGATPMASIPGALPEQVTSAAMPQPSRTQTRQGIAQQRLEEAQKYRTAGFVQEADAMEKGALELMPKVKGWEKVMQDGKAMLAPYFEDGSSGAPVPLEVAEKLEKSNSGKTTDFSNPFTGKVVSSITNTQSPDAILSASTARRGQDLTNARSREELAMGGKPPPGYRWTPDGTLAAIPGGPGDKLPESQQKQVVGVNNLSNAIREYRSELGSFGKLDALSPDARARMGTKYNNMMLQAKEAYTLGVLNGPDLSILESIITDPRSLKGAITSKSALDTQASELDRIMQGVGAVSSQVRQPQQSGARTPAPGGKKISLADIAETARKSGRTTAEVTAAAKAKGYTIGGE